MLSSVISSYLNAIPASTSPSLLLLLILPVLLLCSNNIHHCYHHIYFCYQYYHSFYYDYHCAPECPSLADLWYHEAASAGSRVTPLPESKQCAKLYIALQSPLSVAALCSKTYAHTQTHTYANTQEHTTMTTASFGAHFE